MAKKLYLTFESMSGKEKSIAVSLPKPNLTKEMCSSVRMLWLVTG